MKNLKTLSKLLIIFLFIGHVKSFAQADITLNSPNTTGQYSATHSITLSTPFSTSPGGTFKAYIIPPPAGSGMANAINIGTLCPNVPYIDTKSNDPANGFGNNYSSTNPGQPNGQPSDDIWYKFSLTGATLTTIQTCGSGLQDTYLHLLDVNGNEIYYDDDSNQCGEPYQSYLNVNLSAGTYYVVVEGYYMGSGNITTQISTPPGPANGPDMNFITSWTPRVPLNKEQDMKALENDKNSINIGTEYFDGLGRLIQTVQKQASPAGNDVIEPIAYDQYGRNPVNYLPYPAQVICGLPSGSYRANALDGGTGYSSSEQFKFYQTTGQNIATTPFPYTETSYDGSPINRVVEQGEVGDAWQLTGKTGALNPGHTIKISNVFNNNISYSTDPVNSRQVQLYTAVINADGSRTLSWNGNTPTYADNQLYVTIVKDQNWSASQTYPRAGTTESYRDKDGRLILKRLYNYNTATAILETLSTYYVYDDLENICFILTPKAEADGGGVNQNILDNLCYQYFYDGRQRMVGKKEPSKGWDFMIYNQLDQLVLAQDPNQRKNPLNSGTSQSTMPREEL